MFALIMNIFRRSEKTVESITASLDTMVRDLMEHAEQHLEEASKKGSQAAKLVGEVAEHNTAAIKAQSIAVKVGDLLK